MIGKKLATIVSAGVVAASLGAVSFAPQAAAQNGNFGRVQAAAPNRPHGEKPDRPLRVALRALNRAKLALQRADKDSAGHREQALDLVNRAIDQTQQAIRVDK